MYRSGRSDWIGKTNSICRTRRTNIRAREKKRQKSATVIERIQWAELIDHTERADRIERIELVQLIEYRTDKCNNRDTENRMYRRHRTGKTYTIYRTVITNSEKV